MAIDPICHMEVDEATALSAENDGETFYFCSEHCRTKFLATTTGPASHAECCHAEPTTVALQTSTPSKVSKYVCPMCEGVESDLPGNCPKCGMALESAAPPAPSRRTIYTCPMHAEIEQDQPGTCPKCGMDLEPKFPTAEEQNEGDTELRNMTRRFWVSVALGLPVFLLAMLPMVGVPLDQWIPPSVSKWAQFIFCTPVALWAGWPFFERGWRSVVTWNLNMFTLIALGVGAAYFYSGFALLFPSLIPEAFREAGTVQVYFEAAAIAHGQPKSVANWVLRDVSFKVEPGERVAPYLYLLSEASRGVNGRRFSHAEGMLAL